MNSLKWHNVGALISFSTDKLSRLNTHNWVKNLWTWMLAPRLTIEGHYTLCNQWPWENEHFSVPKLFVWCQQISAIPALWCDTGGHWFWISFILKSIGPLELLIMPGKLPSLPLIRYQQNKTGKQSTGIGLKESSIVLFSNEWHWNQANIAFYYSRIL